MKDSLISIPDMSDSSKQQLAINKLYSTLSNNITNTYDGPSDTMRSLIDGQVEPGKRDIQAGIQYFTPNQGINRKTLIQPIIGPRITDQEIWGKTSTVRSNINKQTYRDITDNDLDLNDMNNWKGTRRSLGVPQIYQHRTIGANVEMNSIHDPNPFGSYPGGQALALQDERDFNGQILPFYKNKNNFPIVPPPNKKEMECKIPGLNRSLDIEREMDPNEVSCYYDTELRPTTSNPNDVNVSSNRESFKHRYYNNMTNSTPSYQYSSNSSNYSDDQDKDSYNLNYTEDNPMSEENINRAKYMNKLYENTYAGQGNQEIGLNPNSTYYPKDQYTKVMGDKALQDHFKNNGAKLVPPQDYYGVTNRVPPGKNVQTTPVTDQLLSESPAYVLTDQYFKQPSTKLYLQDIQPKLYSYAVDPTPINSNIGITYTPQEPPRVLSQIADSSIGAAYPLYSRIDPQLVRKDGTRAQLSKNPVRTNWSQEYSNFDAPPGTINYEDIYDPRFNSYGDPYRSYTDINLGQVQYYYSDVDAYTRPNFITRSNIDFVEFTDPMGRVKPYYNRTASLDEVRGQVENERTADELLHRQDIMSSLMAKRQSEMWQLRQSPLRRTANSNMSYGPT